MCIRDRYVHKNGAFYEGWWVDDLQHGKGKETWADGSKYEGEYWNGKKQGFGKYEWADGSKYEGMWVNNEISGEVIGSVTTRASIRGWMEENTSECGPTMISMGKEFILGLMAGRTRASTRTIRRTDMGFTGGQMEGFMKDGGTRASNTD
eukprot:TRINITY_DN2744_c0_g2_i1.p1 TRINITY_DN2744_c0_g2~~TRINITY_DN2744_c0_g2_i1.p1  ORF type:complete len:150 (+),score=27.90 TRINITY_DN2744_c0_g2_i1:73-522(+)